MRYFESAPSAPLAGLVVCYWHLDKEYGPGHQPGEWVFPDGTTDLVLQNRGRFSVGRRRLPPHFYVGPRHTPLLLRCRGRARVVGIRFHAHGAHGIFGRTQEDLLDHVTPLSELTDPLTAQPLPATPWAAFAALDKFLLAALANRAAASTRLDRAVRWLQRTKGSRPIGELAAHLRISARQLERLFRPATGFSPKQLARIYRFNAVRDQLMAEPGTGLTGLAHGADYHDQSHFTHDFHRLAGRAPTRYSREASDGRIRFNT